MSYEILEQQIRALPEVESFMTYIQYKFGNKRSVDMEKFRKDMAASQAWAKSAGMTEQDITDAIKEVRAANRAHVQA